ncbi:MULTISPECIES: DUF6215 domain-containing protein [unclassified Streptomyces]|uniref:DUF6215 domain-containing protein n=1 Tax=unclassified Streptomyces TaxID=2593676 RepID=UPI0037943177
MSQEVGTITKGAALGQGLTAVALIAAMGTGLWLAGESVNSTGGPKPATCSHGLPEETAAPAEAGQVTGAQLCAALHRPDLPELLGTPGEPAKNANGGESTSKPVGSGKEIHTPTASVEFETYTVDLKVSYGQLTVATMARLLGDGAPPRTVLGRPATLYSDRTMSFSFSMAGGGASTGIGVPTRGLVVALDPQDGGGAYELNVWRSDGGVPDDAVVLRVAEKVLPTVPGWSATAAG